MGWIKEKVRAWLGLDKINVQIERLWLQDKDGVSDMELRVSNLASLVGQLNHNFKAQELLKRMSNEDCETNDKIIGDIARGGKEWKETKKLILKR